MDRLAELISKLNEQFAQNAGPAQLMITTQLIEAELNKLSSAAGKTLGTAKVAVTMPSVSRVRPTVTIGPSNQPNRRRR